MKEREFDIKNYKVQDIMHQLVQKELELKLKQVTHEWLKEDQRQPAYINVWSSSIVEFNTLPKKEQNKIIKLAKEQYEEKKKQTIKKYTELRKKCDTIFNDDNMYKKLTPELNHLYYCQAYTALSDFYDKKIRSKAVSNSRFQARAMSYSKIACD